MQWPDRINLKSQQLCLLPNYIRPKVSILFVYLVSTGSLKIKARISLQTGFTSLIIFLKKYEILRKLNPSYGRRLIDLSIRSILNLGANCFRLVRYDLRPMHRDLSKHIMGMDQLTFV